ncbi:anti-repressor SinI family protein [Piscibacillus sp. B03]
MARLPLMKWGGKRTVTLSEKSEVVLLDREWVELIREAKKLGLSVKEIETFIKDKS